MSNKKNKVKNEFYKPKTLNIKLLNVKKYFPYYTKLIVLITLFIKTLNNFSIMLQIKMQNTRKKTKLNNNINMKSMI